MNIDKNKVEEILKKLWKEDDGFVSIERISYNKALQDIQCEIDKLEINENTTNFLELKESKDERVRKEILEYIHKATGCKEWIACLEKQGEQKLDDSVEPKFRVGDWVMYKSGDTFSNGSISAHIQRIEGHRVWFKHGTYAEEWELKKKITD